MANIAIKIENTTAKYKRCVLDSNKEPGINSVIIPGKSFDPKTLSTTILRGIGLSSATGVAKICIAKIINILFFIIISLIDRQAPDL